MPEARAFDVIVYGATGFTGRLVAEHMLAKYGVGKGVRWALAGRSKAKLETVRNEIGAPAELPLVIADASDAASITVMALSTKAIVTTVGPYQLYGEPLVAACAGPWGAAMPTNSPPCATKWAPPPTPHWS